MISWPAAKGMRCVNPSSATRSPALTKRAIASARRSTGVSLPSGGRESSDYRPFRAIIAAAMPARRAAPVRPAADPPSPPSDPDFMLSLARGLAVIRAFGEGKPQLSIREVALATGVSRAAARRCLHTLITLGYATGADGLYELTPATLSLASNYLGSTSVARVAQPILERVSAQLHESSSVAVLDGDDIVYVPRAAVRRMRSIGR